MPVSPWPCTLDGQQYNFGDTSADHFCQDGLLVTREYPCNRNGNFEITNKNLDQVDSASQEEVNENSACIFKTCAFNG